MYAIDAGMLPKMAEVLLFCIKYIRVSQPFACLFLPNTRQTFACLLLPKINTDVCLYVYPYKLLLTFQCPRLYTLQQR